MVCCSTSLAPLQIQLHLADVQLLSLLGDFVPLQLPSIREQPFVVLLELADALRQLRGLVASHG